MQNTQKKMDSASLSTRKNILQCAIELIKYNGYSKVTIQQICKAAKITKSTFYYHFKSKDHLLEDFTTQIGYDVEQDFSLILMEDTFIKQIWGILKVYFERNILVGPQITKQVFISHLNAGDQKDFPRSAYAWEMMVKLIEKAQNAKEIPNLESPDKICMALYSATRGVCVTWSIENGDFDLITEACTIVNTILSPREGFSLTS